jgi:hypothetical protein
LCSLRFRWPRAPRRRCPSSKSIASAPNGTRPRPAQAGAAERAELAATYRSAEADAIYIVAAENGKLVARGRTGETLPLSGAAADRFRAGPVRVLFRCNAPGQGGGPEPGGRPGVGYAL